MGSDYGSNIISECSRPDANLFRISVGKYVIIDFVWSADYCSKKSPPLLPNPVLIANTWKDYAFFSTKCVGVVTQPGLAYDASTNVYTYLPNVYSVFSSKKKPFSSTFLQASPAYNHSIYVCYLFIYFLLSSTSACWFAYAYWYSIMKKKERKEMTARDEVDAFWFWLAGKATPRLCPCMVRLSAVQLRRGPVTWRRETKGTFGRVPSGYKKQCTSNFTSSSYKFPSRLKTTSLMLLT
jgi:hypothetical protein